MMNQTIKKFHHLPLEGQVDKYFKELLFVPYSLAQFLPDFRI